MHEAVQGVLLQAERRKGAASPGPRHINAVARMQHRAEPSHTLGMLFSLPMNRHIDSLTHDKRMPVQDFRVEHDDTPSFLNITCPCGTIVHRRLALPRNDQRLHVVYRNKPFPRCDTFGFRMNHIVYFITICN